MEFFGLNKGLFNHNFPNLYVQDMYSDRFSQYYNSIFCTKEDIAFFIKAGEASGGSDVLELGCGAGRVTVPLLERGFRVTGVDISGDMLDILKSKSGAFSSSLKIIQDDMCKFQCGSRFHMAILPAAALNIIDNKKALFQNIYEKLYDEGIFVISYSDYTGITKDELMPGAVFINPNGSFAIMTEKIEITKARSLVNIYLEEIEQNGETKRYITSVHKNALTSGLIQEEYEAAGYVSIWKASVNIGRFGYVHEVLAKRESSDALKNIVSCLNE